MAERPWIKPEDVKGYSSYSEVTERRDEALVIDIARAEQYVISCCNNTFGDCETLPESVRIAVILLAEYYAFHAVDSEERKHSESFDDYSYTLADRRVPTIEGIGLDALLEDFKQAKGKANITFKLTAL